MVAHLPPRASLFKHAGNEVWYKNHDYDGIYIECPNSAEKNENGRCSNSLWLKTGVTAHRYYFGYKVNGICNKK
jgi:hypothetical protein